MPNIGGAIKAVTDKAQRRWLERHPGYWRTYRQTHKMARIAYAVMRDAKPYRAGGGKLD